MEAVLTAQEAPEEATESNATEEEEEKAKDPRDILAEARRLARDIEKIARDQAREIENTARETVKTMREEQRARRHEERENRKRKRHQHGKESTLNLRIDENMAERLKEEADKHSVPVSELVRRVLDDTFELVEDSIEEVGELVEGVVSSISDARKNEKRSLVDKVVSWQEVILNKSATCAHSDETLPAGEKAYMGTTEWPARRIYVSSASLKEIQKAAKKAAAEAKKAKESGNDTDS